MSRAFTFTTYLYRDDDEIEVTVAYTCTPFVDATYWQPAEGGEVEIDSVTRDGAPFETTEAEDDKLVDEATQHATEDMADDAAAAAEYRAEQRADDLMIERFNP